MSDADPIAAMREQIAADARLARRLATESDDAFVDATLAIAAERGIPLDAEQLRAATDAGRRAWLMRWLR